MNLEAATYQLSSCKSFCFRAGRSKLQRFDGMTCCKIIPGFRPQNRQSGKIWYICEGHMLKRLGPFCQTLQWKNLWINVNGPDFLQSYEELWNSSIISLNHTKSLLPSCVLGYPDLVIKGRSQWQQLGKKLWVFDVLDRPDLWCRIIAALSI